MWRNKHGQVKSRFASGQGRHFGRNDRQSRNNRRDELRDIDSAGYGDNQHDSRDNDRNFRQESREYDRGHDRYSRLDIDNLTHSYADDRDIYPDIQTTSFDCLDEFENSALYRNLDIERRNAVKDDYGAFDERNDLYWEDRRPQELDDFRNRDQELRTEDFYRSREPTDLNINTFNRYDNDLRNDQTGFRETEHHNGRQDNIRDWKLSHHQYDSSRYQSGRAKFNETGSLGHGRRISRHIQKDKTFNEKKPAFKASHIRGRRQHSIGKHNSRAQDRLEHNKRHGSAKRSSSRDRRKTGGNSSTVSKVNVERSKSNDSAQMQSHKSETASKKEHKKAERKYEKKTKMKNSEASAKDNNSQKTCESSKRSQSKHRLDRGVSSSCKKVEGKRQSSSTKKVESSGFKKPGDKQHQPRPRSNSGRKMDSDSSYFHDEDILSIMADDDGFEHELKTYSNTDGQSKSRNRASRETGSQPILSRSNSRESRERQHSRDRKIREKQQLSRERGSHERQHLSRDRSSKCDSNIKSAYDKHSKAETKVGQEDQTSKFRSPDRISDDIRKRSSTSTSRFKADVNQGHRQISNRQHYRHMVENNNNSVGGRSRFFVASKIKDSYLKRRKTGVGNKRFGNARNTNRQTYKPLNVHNQSHLSQQKNGNEIGITGAILKDDRIRDNSKASDSRNRDRADTGGKKGNRFDRNNRSFPVRKKNWGYSKGRLETEGAKFGYKERFSDRQFRSKGLASHRVKQKYFRGGFAQNRKGGQYNNGRKKSQENKPWNTRSVVDKNKYTDMIEQEDIPKTEQLLENQSLEPNQQQVIFIPNTDLQTGQSHMIDHYGQIILNPDADIQQGEEQVPIQYLPQQFHPDGVPPGEQVVFIPFVNNQVPAGYSENLALAYDETPILPNEGNSMPEERQRQTSATSNTRLAVNKKKPLTKQARAKLRKSLEMKRKQRMEKEIEKKLLKKLLNNPDINKAVRENNEVKKKQFIKRISPPGSSKPYQSNKHYKLIKRGNNSGDLEDVSEDEAVYDNVSDLEDVSEYEDEGTHEYDSRQGKRPVFRKPGQPRKNKSVSEPCRGNRESTSGDIRRVVDYSSRQLSSGNDQSTRINPVNSIAKSKQGERSRRSVYIENYNDNEGNVTGLKRVKDSLKNESKPLKKRRSISPIEITVSNDRYSKAELRVSGNENLGNEKHYSRNRNDDKKSDHKQKYNEEADLGGRFNRMINERGNEYKKGGNTKHLNVQERDRQRHGETDIRKQEKSDQTDRDEKRNRKDEHYHSSSDAEENYGRKIWGKEKSSSGKYEDKKEHRKDEDSDRHRQKSERNYNKNESIKDNIEVRDEYNEDKRAHGSDRRYADTWRNRSERDNRTKDMIKNRNRNERKRSLSRDRSLLEGRNTAGQEGNRVDNRDHMPSRNMHGNSFVSSINQSQFQMNQPLMQQSVQPQPFITAQSQSVPLHGQSVMQFSNSGNTVDHSLPPVQNAPMSMPPFPAPNLGVRPDMSLPPPVMNVVGTPTSMSTMVIQQQHQQPNSVQFQQQPIQQVNMQQQPIQQQQQQQQFQNIQPPFQQQQFHQMQSQPQIIHQQSNAGNFQSHQTPFQTNLQSNQQMSLQQMQSGHFQQTRSGVTMMPVNQNQMQQTASINQDLSGTNQQGRNQQQFVATTPQQAVRGLIGTFKQTGSKAVIRAKPVRIAASMNQVSGSPTTSRRPVNTKSSYDQGGSFGSQYHDNDENEVDDDDFLEMLCSKCDKVFLSHEVMRRHGRWHDMVESNTKNWRCDQCEQGFSSSSDHTEHMSVKHARDSWNCSLCDMTFSNSAGLNKHVRHSSHKDLKVKFVCSLCPASFMVLLHLVQHKKDNHQSNMGYSGLRKY